MESQAITGRRNRRGFNLIEAAIVLGVVGLIIGGIWVAASAVRGKMEANNSVEFLMRLAMHIQKVLPAWSNTGGDCGSTLSLLPADIAQPALSTWRTIPWSRGRHYLEQLLQICLSSSPSAEVEIYVRNVPPSYCRLIASRFSSLDPNKKIVIIKSLEFVSGGAVLTTYPIPIEGEACSGFRFNVILHNR